MRLPDIRPTLPVDLITEDRLAAFIRRFSDDTASHYINQLRERGADWFGESELRALAELEAAVLSRKRSLSLANGTASPAEQLERIASHPMVRQWDLMMTAIRDMPATALEYPNPLLHVFTQPIKIIHNGTAHLIAGGAHIKIHGWTPMDLSVGMLEPVHKSDPHPYGWIGYTRFTRAYRSKLDMLRSAGDLASYLEVIFEYLTTWDEDRMPPHVSPDSRLTLDHWPIEAQ